LNARPTRAWTYPARDPATIVAISIVAFAIANVLHEGVGHGGACLLMGGHARVLSTVHFECDRASRFIAAGGTLANFIAGFLSWIAVRRAHLARADARFFLWLLMTVNLLQAAGYFLFSGVADFGDWADVIHGLEPIWLWRTALTVVGALSYLLLAWLALLELRRFLGPHEYHRGAARDLTIIPYLVGGLLYTVAGLFNPVGVILVGLSAAAASFGGTSGMAWMTQYLGTALVPQAVSEPLALPRSRGWIVGAVVTAIIFTGVLGPGVRFHWSA
jgi:hypothetical protein